jgi:hypothetical protein
MKTKQIILDYNIPILVEVPDSWNHHEWFTKWNNHIANVEDDTDLSFVQYMTRFGAKVTPLETWSDFETFYKDLDTPF